MGQRLNFEIEHNHEIVINCYLHWSAYTIDAAEYAASFVNAWKQHKDDEHPDAIDEDELWVLRLVDTFAELKAGFDETEIYRVRDMFCQLYPSLETALRQGEYKAINRNEGLLAVTQEGIDETERWEEGRVVYDIDSDIICFDVCWFEGEDYTNFCERYEDDRGEKCQISNSDIPYIDVDFGAIPADKMNDVANKLSDVDSLFKTQNGYYSMI